MSESLDACERTPRWGVRTQSTLIAAITVTVALVLGGVLMLVLLHRANTESMYRATGRQAYQIATAVQRGGVAAVDPDDLAPGAGVDMVQVSNADGVVLTASPGAPGKHIHVNGAHAGADVADPYYADDVRIPGYSGVYCATVVGAEYQGQYYEVVALDLASGIRDSEWTAATLMAVELPVIVALGAAAVYLLVGRSLRSVSRISRRVNEITASQLEQRVPVPRAKDEIRTLATTMNGMLERLDASHQAQQRFVGDASHELRSPLTTVVGLLDLADDTGAALDVTTVRSVLLPEARRMQRIVDDLLLLARADERGLPIASTAVDLDDIVGAEVARLRPRVLLAVHSHIEAARVSGDSEMLARALRNLTDNAVRYARTAIWLHLRVVGSEAVVTVSDDGPGIPRAQRDRVFERFARLDADRRDVTGSGLGLAIVREIVNAHGGQVRIVDGDTKGACIELRLPISDIGSRRRKAASVGRESRSASSDLAESVPGAANGLDRRHTERLVDPAP